MIISGKNIWITGASSGIGEALACLLVRNAGTLIISARNIGKLERVREKTGQFRNKCRIVPLDLEDEESIQKASREVLEQYGPVDILINNAGVSQRSLTAETPLHVDRRIMEINYFGTISLTKKILPSMIKRRKGQITVISSVTGKFGFPLRSAYAASKHALIGFFDTLRAELSDHNIRILLVCPGRIRTNISINALDRNGKQYGIMDHGQSKGMSPITCAKIIARSIERDRKEIAVGREKIMIWIRRFSPWLYYILSRRINPR